MRYFQIIIILAFALTGCQTNQLKAFEKLKVGMDKDDVLDIMGSPQATQRWQGMDRWSYEFLQDEQLYKKEVRFSESISNYVGEVFVPEVSALQQDQANAAANKEVEAQEIAKKQDAIKGYSDYENSVRGEKDIRFVPSFTPVQ